MYILVNRDVVRGDVLQSVVNTAGKWKVVGVSGSLVFLQNISQEWLCEYEQEYLKTFMTFVVDSKKEKE